jgi:hypothetical protein
MSKKYQILQNGKPQADMNGKVSVYKGKALVVQQIIAQENEQAERLNDGEIDQDEVFEYTAVRYREPKFKKGDKVFAWDRHENGYEGIVREECVLDYDLNKSDGSQSNAPYETTKNKLWYGVTFTNDGSGNWDMVQGKDIQRIYDVELRADELQLLIHDMENSVALCDNINGGVGAVSFSRLQQKLQKIQKSK